MDEWRVRSDAWFADLIIALRARVTDVVTLFNAERNTAREVAAHPAADDACAPLAASCLQPRLCVCLFCAVWALDLNRIALSKHPRRTLVFLQLLSPKELGKLSLAIAFNRSRIGQSATLAWHIARHHGSCIFLLSLDVDVMLVLIWGMVLFYCSWLLCIRVLFHKSWLLLVRACSWKQLLNGIGFLLSVTHALNLLFNKII